MRALLHTEGRPLPSWYIQGFKREGLIVVRIVKKLQFTAVVVNLPRPGRPSKLSTETQAFIMFIG